jgi:hypothetical protein
MTGYYCRLNGDDDDEGVELVDDATAREAARDMLGQAIRDGEVKHGGELLVSDAAGRRVARFSFSEEA